MKTEKPNRYWTKERRIEDLKYSSQSQFNSYGRGIYCSALDKDCLYDICKHMIN